MAAGAGLLGVDAQAVEAAAQRLRAVSVLLRDAVAATRHAAPAGWSGAGSAASATAGAAARDRLGELSTAVEAASLVLSTLAVALRTAQGETIAARRVLGSAGMEVREPVTRQLETATSEFDDADRRSAALLADAFLSGVLARRPRELVTVPPLARAQELAGEITVVPPAPSTPAAVSVWWAGLPVTARNTLTAAWPWVAGGLDGVPAQVRDGVNRRRLAYALDEAERRCEQARHPAFGHELTTAASRLLPWPLSWVGHALTAAAVHAAAARVTALRALTQTLRTRGSELLAFDAAGDGRAVVASGDVESGRAVAVLVPGMNTELEDVPRLADEGTRLAGAAGTIVVAWLGYDTPRVLQVASDARAKSGAGELQRFTAGLRSTGRARQHLTVVSHSYGTLVAGIAARRGLAADDVVLLASPGVEASRASQLRLPPGHVWAARASTDPIQAVYWPAKVGRLLGLPITEVFGPDPAGAAFGAHHFGVGGAYGHSGYFTPGSQSLDNLGRIVSARPVLP